MNISTNEGVTVSRCYRLENGQLETDPELLAVFVYQINAKKFAIGQVADDQAHGMTNSIYFLIDLSNGEIEIFQQDENEK